jgi:hypothetical protein
MPLAPKILIAVIGYNRPRALSRLLESLKQVQGIDQQVDLLISLDGAGDPECLQVSKGMDWQQGGVKLAPQSRHLGLKEHVESVIARVMDYDAIVILEDDLSVSPWMLHYCQQAFQYFHAAEKVAQIALYGTRLNDTSGLPFEPMDDGFDCWFARYPCSWGYMITRSQWQKYNQWRNNGSEMNGRRLPEPTEKWGHSWKRDFFSYLASSESLVVYPRVSLSTNHGDPGANYGRPAPELQVPLEAVKRQYTFSRAEESSARYDEWLEPFPGQLGLESQQAEKVVVDLMGQKTGPFPKDGYLLSSKPCTEPILEFSMDLIPLEQNVRWKKSPSGDDKISLGKAESFIEKTFQPGILQQRIPPRLYEAICRQAIEGDRREKKTSEKKLIHWLGGVRKKFKKGRFKWW